MMKLGGRSGKIDRQIRIKLGDCPAQRRPHRFGALAVTRPNKDGDKLIWQITSEKRHVEAGVVSLLIEWSLHQRVRDYADDCPPGVRPSGIKNANLMTNRALIPPIFSGKTRVHQCHPLFGIGIIEREIPTFQNLQPECGEIIIGDVFKVSARTIAIAQIILSVYLELAAGRKCHSETTSE